MTHQNFHHTAAQLAKALGFSKPTVLAALADVSPTGTARVGNGGGIIAQAWSLASLPSRWQTQLADTARARGFRDAAHLLAEPPARWVPPVPLAEVSPSARDKAAQLQRALRPMLERQHDPGVSDQEFIRLGVVHYCQEFRSTITERKWKRLFDRTVERDGGAEQWSRVEIFLDTRPARQASPAVATPTAHPPGPVIAAFKSPACPTPAELRTAWLRVVEYYDGQVMAGVEERSVRLALVDYLHERPPALTRSGDRESLARQLSRKLEQWAAGGRKPEAFDDRRHTSSGNYRRPDFAQDDRTIAQWAAKFGNNHARAVRYCKRKGLLSAAYCAYYKNDPRKNKSAVAKATLKACRQLVKAGVLLLRGEKTFRLSGPYTTRDWFDTEPGDWFNFDDVTWNHYFKVPLVGGGWDILRGECLVGTDEKSDYPLDFLLIAGKYNSLHIRRLIDRIEQRVGLPRIGITLERGVWASCFVVGRKDAGWQPLDGAEWGLNDPRIGLHIQPAFNPNTKVIEGVFNRLQQAMRVIPGFVGFNERTEKMERMQETIRQARRGDAAALDQFLTQEQWQKEIRSVMKEFTNDPGNGERLDGLTPNEAFGEALLKSPLRKLHEDARPLISTHEKIARLSAMRGVVLKVPGYKVPICYCNEETGKLVERGETEVRVRIDLEHPEFITCYDMKNTVRFSVQGQLAPAKTATREHLVTLAKNRREHAAPVRALFGNLKHDIRSNIVRDGEQDSLTMDEGRFHQEELLKHKAVASEDRRRVTKAQKAARSLNMRLPDAAVRRPESVDAAADLAKMFAEDESANRAEEKQ